MTMPPRGVNVDLASRWGRRRCRFAVCRGFRFNTPCKESRRRNRMPKLWPEVEFGRTKMKRTKLRLACGC